MKLILIAITLTAVCFAVCALLIIGKFRQLCRRFEDFSQANRNIYSELSERIAELENGTVPDYEKAKEAAKAVNDFNRGISAIMGYDPFEARKKAQEERGDIR